MAFLLCHDCYSWVEPDGERCPECYQTLDPNACDPPAVALRTAIGDVVRPLGAVRVSRSLLPEVGMLYATTRGLCFIPHDAVAGSPEARTSPPGSSLFWTLATLLWSPLGLVRLLIQTQQFHQQRLPILQPRELTGDEPEGLAALLMEDPGVFFVPRRLIRTIRRRRQRWYIARVQGPTLKLTPYDNRNEFHAGMGLLLSSPDWQGLTARTFFEIS